jgi:hypothetical protein
MNKQKGVPFDSLNKVGDMTQKMVTFSKQIIIIKELCQNVYRTQACPKISL